MQNRMAIIQKFYAARNEPLLNLLEAFKNGNVELTERLYIRSLNLTKEERIIRNQWLKAQTDIIEDKKKKSITLNAFELFIEAYKLKVRDRSSFSDEEKSRLEACLRQSAALDYLPSVLLGALYAAETRDFSTAKAYAEQAIKLRCATGYTLSALIPDRPPADPEEMVSHLSKYAKIASECGSISANYLLGECLQETVERIQSYEKAVTSGMDAALYRLANIFSAKEKADSGFNRSLGMASWYARHFDHAVRFNYDMVDSKGLMNDGCFVITHSKSAAWRIFREARDRRSNELPFVVFNMLLTYKHVGATCYIDEIKKTMHDFDRDYLQDLLLFCKGEIKEDVRFVIESMSHRTRLMFAFSLYNACAGLARGCSEPTVNRRKLPSDLIKLIVSYCFGEQVCQLYVHEELLHVEKTQERNAYLTLSLFGAAWRRDPAIRLALHKADQGKMAYSEIVTVLKPVKNKPSLSRAF